MIGVIIAVIIVCLACYTFGISSSNPYWWSV